MKEQEYNSLCALLKRYAQETQSLKEVDMDTKRQLCKLPNVQYLGQLRQVAKML